MGYKFKAGDWAVKQDGCRVYVVGRDSDGELWAQFGEGGNCELYVEERLTHLPDCTGWDWQPAAPAASAPAADDPADVAYVVLQVKRAVWDGLQIGEQVPADAVYSANEAMPVVAMCGATMLLLPD